MKILKENEIYKHYENTGWSSVTLSQLETHLDAIPMTSVENLPLIRYLTSLHKYKMAEKTYAQRAIDSNPFATFYQPPYTAPTDLDAYLISRSSVTLSSGSGSSALYQPGAGFKYVVYWGWFSTNNVTNPNTTYHHVKIYEESGSGINEGQFCNIDMGHHKFPCYQVASTADKDLKADIAQGVAAEYVRLHLVLGKFTA